MGSTDWSRTLAFGSALVIFLAVSGERAGAAPAITEFPVPTAASMPFFIIDGPDGNLWFTEQQGNKIGRVTMAGQITEFSIPTANSNPQYITVGSDGNLW